MLTKEELLDLDVPPLIKNVSLELYKEFAVDYLLARKFIYHFSDGSKTDNAVNARFKNQKKRISMFACVYNTLRKGQAFYIPSGKVKNTNNVKVDYILYRTLDNNNGMNLGVRRESGKFVPLTILISKQSSLMNYVDIENFKLVEKLEITDMRENVIETISYALSNKDAAN